MTHVREIATVIANDADCDARLLRLKAPAIAAAARPFQFVLVKVPGAGFLLRRPFSVFYSEDGFIELFVKPTGSGTDRLCRVDEGDEVEVNGPFGRVFEIPVNTYFVAGGIGIAGLFFAIADQVKAGIEPCVVFGAQTSKELYALDRLRKLGIKTILFTNDGSNGYKGFVTRYVQTPATIIGKVSSIDSEEILPYPPDTIIACGPRAMYKALMKYSGERSNIYVLMEERMACGVGACRSCAVPAREPEGAYVSVCKDGPLINASAIDWDRLKDLV